MQAKKTFLSKMVTQGTKRAFRTSATANDRMTVRDSIRSAMAQEMTRDEKVFLMGEEVGQYRGAYKVSGDLF